MWVTLQGPCTESGMVVNVAEINRVFRDSLIHRVTKAKNIYELLQQVKRILDDKFKNIKVIECKICVGDGMTVSLTSEELPAMNITKKYEFAASHRLWNPAWDDKKNLEVYGKCSNAGGHGHNYIVEITLELPDSNKNFNTADAERMDEIVQEAVLDRLDHKNLNEEMAEFAETIPTMENITRVIWRLLAGKFEPLRLYRVAVWETPRCYTEYFGPPEKIEA